MPGKKKKDGKKIDKKPRLLKATVVGRDITQRKRAEDMLQKEKEKFINLIENTPIGISISTPQGKVTEANSTLWKMFNYDSKEEYLNIPAANHYFDPKDRERMVELRKAKGTIADFEVQFKRKDGSGFWGSVNSVLEQTSDGSTQIVSSLVDITERKRAEEKARESAERFENIFNNAGDGILLADLEKKTFLMGNKAICRMLGYNPEEINNLGVMDIHPEKDIPYVIAQFEKQAKGEFTLSRDLPVKRKDGTVLYADINATTVTSAGKTYLMGFFHDITERKAAEESLRRSEESFRLISENASDFITIIDREGVMLYASPSHRLLGYDPKEVVGKSLLDFVNAKDKEKTNSLLQLLAQAKREDLIQIVKERKSDRYVYRFDDKSGNIHYLESKTNIIENNETGDFNVLFVARDITKRKQGEESLRRSEERFRLISENSSDLIALINMQGEYIYASPSHRRFGLEPGDLIGKSALTGIHPDDAHKVVGIGMKYMSASKEELSRIAKEAVNEQINCRYIDGWGQIRHLEIKKDLVEDAENQEFNILLIGRDVTETKKMEAELLKNEKLQSLSVLAGGIAHDFNNLLAAIMGNVSVALNTTDSKSEMHELLKDVETASHRASGLVQKLITFARGGIPVKKKMAIGQLLKDDVQMALSGSRVECEYSLPEDLWPVKVDAGQFGQVVSNLVINAVQATPEGGKIGVRAKNMRVGKEFGDNLSEGEYVKISFRDSGKGILPENLPKIFDPFFTTRPESSGLGLSAVYSIIKRHRGHITVESAPERGATFSVYLPARRENGREESKPGLEKTNGAQRVLVMDDELMVQKVTGRMLTQIGYEVEFAQDGQEAIEIYQKARETSRPFAAVIMDLTIPGGMGGKIAVQKLIEIDPQVKVIVSSGYSNDPVMSDHRKYGFRGVIAKPYRFEEMAEVIKQVIGNE